MYLPAGPSGHIVSSNYDLYSEFYMGWVFTIILYILVRLLFYFALSFWGASFFRAGWQRVPVGGNPVNNVTHYYLFYAGFLLNYVCACEFYLYIVLCVL